MEIPGSATVAQGARRKPAPLAWLAPGVFLGALWPAVLLLLRAATGDLGANPIAEAENQLGLTSLVFLVASLACTPLKLVAGWSWPLRIRRQLGLWAFAYAGLHFAVFLGLDHGLDLGALVADIAKRPFILVGSSALLVLAVLALTSTQVWTRRLGFVRWKQLHRAVYVAGILACVHFLLRVKAADPTPLFYAAVLGVLLGVRLVPGLGKKRRAA